jgi:hypothetical protein
MNHPGRNLAPWMASTFGLSEELSGRQSPRSPAIGLCEGSMVQASRPSASRHIRETISPARSGVANAALCPAH